MILDSMIINFYRVKSCHNDDYGLNFQVSKIISLLSDSNTPIQTKLLHALTIEEEFSRVLHSIPSKRKQRYKDFFSQRAYDEINALIYYSSEKDRLLLPPALYNKIKKRAKKNPEQIIDIKKSLSECKFSPKTKIFLLYYNELMQESLKYPNLNDTILSLIRAKATSKFLTLLQGVIPYSETNK